MKKKRKAISQRLAFKFNYAVLGYRFKSGISPFDIAIDGLKTLGFKKQDGVSTRAFLLTMKDYMTEYVFKHPVKENTRAKTFSSTSVSGNEFLLTYDWRKLRMQALKLHGARCQCCGASAKDGVKINVDHIKPRKTHPELALVLDNLQVLCEVCNHGKGNWDSTDWRSNLKNTD